MRKIVDLNNFYASSKLDTYEKIFINGFKRNTNFRENH